MSYTIYDAPLEDEARYLYRALRLGEAPNKLRLVHSDLPQLRRSARIRDRLRLRKMVILGIAQGHRVRSACLHASTGLDAARRLLQTQAALYSGAVVRIDRMDLTPTLVVDAFRAGCEVLAENLGGEDGDDAEMESALGRARTKAKRDREVVIFENPPAAAVEYFCLRTGQWRKAAEWGTPDGGNEAILYRARFTHPRGR